MEKLKRLALGLVIAALTLSVGIGTAIYVKQRSRATRCTEASYFPAGMLAHERRTEWMGKYYAAVTEQPFTCFEDNAEVYRLLYLPSFEYPTSIRVWRDGDRYQMTVKQLAAEIGGDVTGKDLSVNSTRTLTNEEWSKIQGLLQNANFWSMPSKDSRESGLDGVWFILEGRKDGKYHAVERWTPQHDAAFIDLSAYLVEITGLKWKNQPSEKQNDQPK